MITVALVEPETPGNIGSVARVMKNFGFRQLVLVNPKCNYLDGEAYGRAMHAVDVLKKATVVKNFAELRKFDYVVGTTAALGSDYNILRTPITPGQLAGQLAGKKGSIAVVFGRESSGLSNAEVEQCDVVVTIPASRRYRALNISHAAAIVLYEIYAAGGRAKTTSHMPLATRKEKGVAMRMVAEILADDTFKTARKKKTHSMVWSRLISKAFLTRREMHALLGFLRKTGEIVNGKRK